MFGTSKHEWFQKSDDEQRDAVLRVLPFIETCKRNPDDVPPVGRCLRSVVPSRGLLDDPPSHPSIHCLFFREDLTHELEDRKPL